MAIFSIKQTNAFRKTRQMISSNRAGFFVHLISFAIILSLPFAAYVAFYNLSHLEEKLDYRPTLSVSFLPQITAQQLSDARVLIERIPAVREAVIIHKENSLAQLKQDPAIAQSLAILGKNPFPDLIIVTPKEINPADLNALAKKIEHIKYVDQIDTEMAWAKELSAILDLLWLIVIGVMSLVIASAFMFSIAANRIEVLRGAQETGLLLSLGGIKSTIQKPYVYFGAILGGLSAALAAVFVFGLLLLLAPEIEFLTAHYQENFTLRFIPLSSLLIWLFVGAFVGVIGSKLSTLSFSETR